MFVFSLFSCVPLPVLSQYPLTFLLVVFFQQHFPTSHSHRSRHTPAGAHRRHTRILHHKLPAAPTLNYGLTDCTLPPAVPVRSQLGLRKIMISVRCTNPAASARLCSGIELAARKHRRSHLPGLVSLELWKRRRKKKRCICNYFPLLPHHYLRDLAPALLLPFSFGLVDQQQRFDIHAAAMIEMQKGVLLAPRSFLPSLSGHFSLHHFFISPSVFVAHMPHFPKNFTYERPV